MENMRLIQQISLLKKEEREHTNLKMGASHKTGVDRLLDDQSAAPSDSLNPDSTDAAALLSDESDTSHSSDHLTLNALDAAGMSHVDGIEVMTGLYYGDGERSQGLSTGIRGGRLVHCDIGSTIAADISLNMESDRRKRLKAQHVCDFCGTATSPEWRKGPNGPKSLCNACGCETIFLILRCTIQANGIGCLVRWSKKEKKRQESA